MHSQERSLPQTIVLRYDMWFPQLLYTIRINKGNELGIGGVGV